MNSDDDAVSYLRPTDEGFHISSELCNSLGKIKSKLVFGTHRVYVNDERRLGAGKRKRFGIALVNMMAAIA